MRLTMKEKRKAAAILAPQYQKARKKDRGRMLDQFVALTGYLRSYASHLLSIHGKRRNIGANRFVEADVRKKVCKGMSPCNKFRVTFGDVYRVIIKRNDKHTICNSEGAKRLKNLAVKHLLFWTDMC